MSTETRSYTLDPVTFEVLKNAFVTIVDEMAEQILRTCHSFVIYARDFSSALCDASGNTIMQGSQDIAVHVGTLHLTAKAVIEAFEGRHPPGRRVRDQRPVPRRHALQRRAHRPADLPRGRADRVRAVQRPLGRRRRQRARARSTSPPRSTSARASASRPCASATRALSRATSSRMIVSNTRAPSDAEGDLHAQAEATRVAEREILRLVRQVRRRDGRDGVRRRCRTTSSGSPGSASRELPDGDVGDRGLHRLRPRQRRGAGPGQGQARRSTATSVHYDLPARTGGRLVPELAAAERRSRASSPAPRRSSRTCRLNSGFYRAIDVDVGPAGHGRQRRVAGGGDRLLLRRLREDHERGLRAVVAGHARARDGVLLQPRVPARRRARRAHATIARSSCGTTGWSAAGAAATARTGRTARRPIFGVGLAVQPLEGQERLCAGRDHRRTRSSPTPAAPGASAAAAASRRAATLTEAERHRHVVLLRPRALGHVGHRRRPAVAPARRLAEHGARPASASSARSSPTCRSCQVTCSRARRPAAAGSATRSSASPRRCSRTSPTGTSPSSARSRTTASWCAEVDAELAEYEVDCGRDRDASVSASARERVGWLEEDAEQVAERYRDGELDVLDLVRQLRGDPRLGHRRAAAENHGDVPRDDVASSRVSLGAAAGGRADRLVSWDAAPVVITVAPTGAEVTRDHNPALPHTPDEIAADAIACEKAGAAVVHLHVREPDGTPSSRVELFQETY